MISLTFIGLFPFAKIYVFMKPLPRSLAMSISNFNYPLFLFKQTTVLNL